MGSEPISLQGNWNYPTAIRFGAGRIRELPEACRELGMQRPLLVTDPVLAELPMTASSVALLSEAGLEAAVFSAIRPNPIGKNVADGVEAYREGGRDGVIAFGGGSALDAAKAVALMVGQRRPVWDFEDVDDWYTRVDEAAMAPVVAVPTTSGTGSEVGRSSLLVHEGEHRKVVIFHPRMLPARVICDPELTVGMPPKLTGAVGMDALSHSLEAFSSPFYHPQAHGIALEGMRLCRRSLVRAFRDGGDLEARAHMLAASLMGATAFQKGLGAMHAVAHAAGGLCDVHHGTTVATMIPYVLRLNRAAIAEQLAALARYLELDGSGVEAVQGWVLDLRRELGIPHTLGELGVPADRLSDLVGRAVGDPTAGTNPVPLDERAATALIEKAFGGDLD